MQIASYADLLPTSEQTALLRACLSTGEECRRSWVRWQERDRDLREVAREAPALRGLWPLLFSALRQSGVPVDSRVRTYLRMAYVRELLRCQIYRRVCRSVLEAFRTVELPVIAVKGAALAETVYAHPALRHSRDIDLLVGAGDLSKAVDVLPRLGFTRLSVAPAAGWARASVEHTSGLPLVLHRVPFPTGVPDRVIEDIWARSQVREIAGTTGRILSPADALLHVCAHAVTSPRRASLRWACDSRLLIDRHPDLAWEVFLDCARWTALTGPLYAALEYLVGELHAAVPASVLTSLRTAFDRPQPLGRAAGASALLDGR